MEMSLQKFLPKYNSKGIYDHRVIHTLLPHCTQLSVICYAEIMHWSKLFHWTFLSNVYEGDAQWIPNGTNFQTFCIFFPSEGYFNQQLE
jgi:hypothetical protein